MSRLNANIKFVVLIGVAFFFLVALSIVALSTLALSGKILALDSQVLWKYALFALVASLCVLVWSIFGCCGAVNQVIRRGVCTGRRMLSIYQLLLLSVLIMSLYHAEIIQRRDKSINLVVSSVDQYPEFDSFERRLNGYFNEAYFKANCVEDSTNTWIMRWINNNCPNAMTQNVCALGEEEKKSCDTRCLKPEWTAQRCCPSQELCATDPHLNEACPYRQCRVQVLSKLRSNIIKPITLFVKFLTYYSFIMVVFTCLLICYNPRDEIEVELVKTGVMTDEDIEAIQKLKKERKFTMFENGAGNQAIDLDTIHHTVRQATTTKKKSGPTRRVMRWVSNDNAIHPML